jgi:hypothetical protein
MTRGLLLEHGCGLLAAAAILWQASAIASQVSTTLSEALGPTPNGHRFIFIGEVQLDIAGWLTALSLAGLTVLGSQALAARLRVSPIWACAAILLGVPATSALVGAALAEEGYAGVVTGASLGVVAAVTVLAYWGGVAVAKRLHSGRGASVVGGAG